MGTHSLIRFLKLKPDGTIVVVCQVYQQFDGYLKGIGMNLAKFLNGFQCFDDIEKPFALRTKFGDQYADLGTACNSIEDMSAQYVAVNKKHAGNLYLYSMEDDQDQEFTYEVVYNETTRLYSVNARYREDDDDSKDVSHIGLTVSAFQRLCESNGKDVSEPRRSQRLKRFFPDDSDDDGKAFHDYMKRCVDDIKAKKSRTSTGV